MVSKNSGNGQPNHNDIIDSVWKFKDKEQKKQMLEVITPENCGVKLKIVREVAGLSRKELAKVIGVAESTIYRLEKKQTLPKTDFMLRLGGLVAIGHAKYSNMSEEEKEQVSEYIGAGGGIIAGVGGAIGAISASGFIGGLSAAGITSGLAAIGGTMLGGLAVVATIPVVAGAAGYGLVKGIKAICEANKLNCKEVDDYWEITPEISDDTGNNDD
jgi:DNA-binding XRE family transcriptional regulator